MLKALREIEQHPELSQEIGTITAAGESTWTVSAASGHHQARRAVSCLVAPEVGDEVLLATAQDGRT
jgi:hypothetical protein